MKRLDVGTLPREALQRLVEGNERFRAGRGTLGARTLRPELAHEGQRPFAVVLGCSDSRTPVEILFDQGFGSLFVVRVAGNIVAPSLVGSIEFAVSQFGTRLVVVMGHTRCGAVDATVRAVRCGAGPASKNMCSITDRIAPHVAELARLDAAHDAVVGMAVRANVRASVDHLRHGSQLLEEGVASGDLVVVGAEYGLETGEVVLLDAGGLSAGARAAG